MDKSVPRVTVWHRDRFAHPYLTQILIFCLIRLNEMLTWVILFNALCSGHLLFLVRKINCLFTELNIIVISR